MLDARTLLACAALSWVVTLAPAFAWNASFTGKITMIEPTYMPAKIVFKSERGAGACAAGAVLTWDAQGTTADERIANAQAVFSALQTVKATNGAVELYVNTTGCMVEFLHIL